MNEIIDILKREGVFDIRNGSAEIFIDDEGLVCKIITKTRRRRRDGQELKVFNTPNTTTIVAFDNTGRIDNVVCETQWRRKKLTL